MSARRTRNRTPRKRRDAGAALAIALLLLPVATLLGVAAIVTATVELRMVANVQLDERAFQAAEFAIEQAIASPDLSTSYTMAAPKAVPTTSGATLPVPGSAGDSYAYRLYFDPAPDGTPRTIAEAGLLAYHFVVEAEGHSARDARDGHVQGFYVVRAPGWSGGAAIVGCEPSATDCVDLPGSLPQRTYWRQQDVD